MKDNQFLKLLALHARKNRNDELFRSWLTVTRAQALDMKVRDMLPDVIKAIKEI